MNKKEKSFFLEEFSQKKFVATQGFSIIELIVVLAIFGMITGMLLIGYPAFRRKTSLKKTAQEIAMAIRQAQAYALGVTRFVEPGTLDEYFPGYGAYFDRINRPDSFVLFADIPIDVSVSNDGNKEYDVGGGCGQSAMTTECVEEFEIQTKGRVIDICGDTKTNAPGVCGLNTLDIVYLRPNPFVSLYANGGTSGPYSDVGIVVETSGGVTKTIYIWTSGQITVE